MNDSKVPPVPLQPAYLEAEAEIIKASNTGQQQNSETYIFCRNGTSRKKYRTRLDYLACNKKIYADVLHLYNHTKKIATKRTKKTPKTCGFLYYYFFFRYWRFYPHTSRSLVVSLMHFSSSPSMVLP